MAERQQRYRAQQRARRPQSLAELLALDAEVIAAQIMAGMPPEKADTVARALSRRLLHWRVGTYDPACPFVTRGARLR